MRSAYTLRPVADTGAQESVKKNELLGEYTGELISQVCFPGAARCVHSALTPRRRMHRQSEADRRGKIYDRVNSSFLFNLNDQWVLDAHLQVGVVAMARHCAATNARYLPYNRATSSSLQITRWLPTALLKSSW